MPSGRVAALVGPNGADKTTLLHLCVESLRPDAGAVSALGYTPNKEQEPLLTRVGFVAQDHPLYKDFTVAEMLTLGRKLNPHWENAIATERLARLHIPLDKRVGKLSGGQQARLLWRWRLPNVRACCCWMNLTPTSIRWPGATSCARSMTRWPSKR